VPSVTHTGVPSISPKPQAHEDRRQYKLRTRHDVSSAPAKIYAMTARQSPHQLPDQVEYFSRGPDSATEGALRQVYIPAAQNLRTCGTFYDVDVGLKPQTGALCLC